MLMLLKESYGYGLSYCESCLLHRVSYYNGLSVNGNEKCTDFGNRECSDIGNSNAPISVTMIHNFR